MMYFGEVFNRKVLGNLNKGAIGVVALFGLAIAAFGVSVLMDGRKISSLKEEIETKSKAVSDSKVAEKAQSERPDQPAIPKGLAAVADFQSRVNVLAKTHGAAVTQFQASDQLNPYVSTFSLGVQTGATWLQIEVKLSIQGPTKSVMDTLAALNGMPMAYEFTSLEVSRTQASPTGQATINANVSLRILTVAGGS